MKLSMWNIYHRLPYPDKIPLIKDGSPTIEKIRWIVSRDLNPSTIYIGSEADFFADARENTLIVHRNDMILIHHADPEEVFNDVSGIVEMYQKWELALKECLSLPNGLTEMLKVSSPFLQNPSFIYAPDGKALAIAPGYPGSIHWHWQEILENRGLTEERLENLQETIDLTNVFTDRRPTTRDSHMGEHQYMHCSIVANGYMAGHFVVFSLLKDFETGLEHLVSHLIRYLTQYMEEHYEIYSPTSRISEFIAALIHERPYSRKEFLLLQKLLRWNNEEDTYQFFILKETVKGEPVRLSGVHLKLSQLLLGSVVFLENNLLILLVNLQHLALREKELNLLLDSFSRHFYCGVSNPFQKIEQAGIYYRQALAELVRCKELQLSRSYGAEHTGFHLTWLLKQDPMNGAYVKRSLLTLMEYDKKERSHYYETLRAWFYSGFHPTAAASLLRIHRNSFNYRMERMRELISFEEIDQISVSRDIPRINEYLYSFMYLDSLER